jgi:hypothetical protein
MLSIRDVIVWKARCLPAPGAEAPHTPRRAPTLGEVVALVRATRHRTMEAT